MTHEVVFAPEAQADLLDLYETIAREGGGDRAPWPMSSASRWACLRLAAFSQAGHPTRPHPARAARDRLRAGIAIAFQGGAERVTIDRILYGGRDLGTVFPEM